MAPLQGRASRSWSGGPWWPCPTPSSMGRWLSALLHCYSVFTGEVSEIASRLGPSAPQPLRAPLRCAPLYCPSPLPTPQPQTSPRESSRPHPVLHHWALSLLFLAVPQPPSSRPTLVLPLCVPRSRKLSSLGPRSLEVCSSPPSGTGGSGVGDIIREIPALGWAGRGGCCTAAQPSGPPLPLRRRCSLPHLTPKPARAGWPPPQRLDWRQQPEECGGWSR